MPLFHLVLVMGTDRPDTSGAILLSLQRSRVFLVSLLVERGGKFQGVHQTSPWAVVILDALMFGHLFSQLAVFLRMKT